MIERTIKEEAMNEGMFQYNVVRMENGRVEFLSWNDTWTADRSQAYITSPRLAKKAIAKFGGKIVKA